MATEITSSTPEEMVAQLNASLGAAQAEHSELKKAFEGLAAETMATTEAIKLEAAEAQKKLADAQAIIATLTGEKETLAKQLAEAQANQITASKEAAKVVASLGVKPVANSPAADAQAQALDAKQILATFLAMQPGADRQAFFQKHKGIIAPGF
jgi:chromosome segregation ATPase